MGLFDFLNDLGESKSNFNVIKTSEKEQLLIEYLEILVSRGLMMEDFKSELINLHFNKKINERALNENIEKSIRVHEAIEYKLVSIDEQMFKKRDNTKEYIGAIDRLPNDKTKLNSERGKLSYNFAVSLLEHLKGRTMNVKMMNNLCDALDCDIKIIFNKEILTEGVIVSNH
jgi:DNA-binding Xre family transcriptional regulator